MKPMKALIYIDSPTTLSHCVAAAEALKETLGAQIVILLVNSSRHAETTQSYEVYDYKALFSRGAFEPVRSKADKNLRDNASTFGASSSVSHKRSKRPYRTVVGLLRYCILTPLRIFRFGVRCRRYIVRLLIQLGYQTKLGQQIG
jgi:hypothetical protein